MRNQYPGTCYRCGERCEAGDGHFERITKSQRDKWRAPQLRGWLTQHANCAIIYRGTDTHHLYAPEPDSCRYCGKGLYQEEADRGLSACFECIKRERLTMEPAPKLKENAR